MKNKLCVSVMATEKLHVNFLFRPTRTCMWKLVSIDIAHDSITVFNSVKGKALQSVNEISLPFPVLSIVSSTYVCLNFAIAVAKTPCHINSQRNRKASSPTPNLRLFLREVERGVECPLPASSGSAQFRQIWCLRPKNASTMSHCKHHSGSLSIRA